MSAAVPKGGLREFFRQVPGHVLLRNHDYEEHLARGGDLDILVESMSEAHQVLLHEFGPPAWMLRRSYVTNHFYRFGHIDLIPRLEWRGAVYLNRDTILRDGTATRQATRQPRLAHEALVSWFTSLLWGGFFKDRYRDVIVEASRKDAVEFKRVLQVAAGSKLGSQLFSAAVEGHPETSKAWAGALRRAVWSRAFWQHPISTLAGFIRFLAREVSLILCPSTPWLAVLGPDGCGKSTVLDLVRKRLKETGVNTSLHHWRPQVLRPNESSAGPVERPHSKPPRGQLASIAKLGMLLLDWQLGHHFRLARLRAKAHVVLFDRYFLDLLVDPTRYRFGGPFGLARFCSKLIPKPDLIFLLDAPTAVLQSRKQEVPAEETERQRQAYRSVIQQTGCNWHILDAARPPGEVAEELIQKLFEHLASTNVRKGPGA